MRARADARRSGSRPCRAGAALAGALFVLLAGCSSRGTGPGADCVPPPSGLVSWWPGDAAARDVAGPHDGTPEGGVEVTEGFVTSGEGQAFRFDGDDALVRVPHVADLEPATTSAFTVEAWARSTTLDRNGTVVGKGFPFGDETLVIDQIEGRWRGLARDERGFARRLVGPPVETGVFTHLALTWDGATLRFYVNGTEVEAGPMSSIAETDAFLGIGGRSEAGHEDAELELEFSGTVDEVSYYGRALDAGEIRSVARARRDGKCRAGL